MQQATEFCTKVGIYSRMQGLALVTVAAQETAEKYVAGLRRNGLTSTLEPDAGCD